MSATLEFAKPGQRRWHVGLTLVLAIAAACLSACGGGSEAPLSTATPASADDRKLALADPAPITDLQALLYIATYDDLIEAFGDNIDAGKAHYAQRAAIENRVIAFDPLRYVATYGDLIGAIGANSASAARHFIVNGYQEGRNRGTFDALSYVAANPSLITSFSTDSFAATRHYIVQGQAQGLSLNFDAIRYIASYGDLITRFGTDTKSATLQFVTEGYPQGRRLLFDAAGYLARYADLRAAFGNDLTAATIHFVVFGYREGRSDRQVSVPTPTPDPGNPGTGNPGTGTVTPPAAAISDTFALTSTDVFSVDVLGTVRRSTNGGASYTTVGTTGVAGTNKVAFGTATAGWVLLVNADTGAPRIFRTTDGGVTWIERSLPTPPPNRFVFASLRAVGADTLIVSNGLSLDGTGTPNPNEPRQILVTRDGGQIWLYRNFDPVFVTKAGVLFSIAGGQVLKSTNFGQSSTATTLTADGTLFKVSFADEVNGLAIGRTSTELYAAWQTRDGGTTWVKLAAKGLPTSASCSTNTEHRLTLSSPDAAVLTIGTACPVVLRTLDGGLNWTASAG